MTTFSGFSEEELKRIKSGETSSKSDAQTAPNNKLRVVSKLGKEHSLFFKHKVSSLMPKVNSFDSIDEIEFEKCKLSISPLTETEKNDSNKENSNQNVPETKPAETRRSNSNVTPAIIENNDRRLSLAPDIVRGMEIYSEDELASHKVKLEELQLRQKLMEEQNKKRKEMLAKALAHRTKQTAEEVMRLEKIKKELQVLDSQFSQDVSVLRGKIDHACLSYAEAEKQYLRVEKEFLQAKIQLQKAKEKKELLTEHLCALITHNETRKAQKLETLMLELATDKQQEVSDIPAPIDEETEIVDGVDEKTGKIVELPPEH